MSQSPISRQVQMLERILGVVLLERTSRSVQLTPAGQVFLIEARRIVRLVDSASLSARQVGKGDSGRLAIGFTAVSGYSLVPRIVAQVRSRLPNLELELREMVTSDQTDGLMTGLIDLGFVRPPVQRHEFEAVTIIREPLVAALPRGDGREAEAALTLDHFHDLPLIMYSRQGAAYFHDMLVHLFDATGSAPRYVQHVTQLHSMLGLVHAGLAAAIVPESASSLYRHDLQFRLVETKPERPAELSMVWRRDNDNPMLEPLRRLVTAMCL